MAHRLDVDAQVAWHGDFYERSPLFAPIAESAAPFRNYPHWPVLVDYQRQLEQLPEPIRLLSGKALRIVAQAGRPDTFADHYAPRIYLTGEIQTRLYNWHDFFQYLTWFIFPRSKAVINALHIPRAQQRIEGGGERGARTPLENMLSLFDEGGVVIASSDKTLLQLIRDFRWKELFWQRRAELEKKLHCVPFGHALYEKGLTPYIGMTANAILLDVEPDYFERPPNEQLLQIDLALAQLFEQGEEYRQPKDLHPLPILGMPGWDSSNKDEHYYDNVNYFRPGRRGFTPSSQTPT